MIYRPFTDYETVNTGLWWSDNPNDDFGPNNPSKEMGLDVSLAGPLTRETHEFINRYWAVLSGKDEEVGDVFQSFGNRDIVVSERTAKIILELETNLHELVSIPNVWSFGSQQRVENKLYFLNVYTVTRTVDLEKSDTFSDVRRTNGKPFTLLDSLTKETCVLYADAAHGRHLWRDNVTLATFMSDTLVDRLKDAGIKGFVFEECTVI